jgi:hypothetical protein
LILSAAPSERRNVVKDVEREKRNAEMQARADGIEYTDSRKQQITALS